MPKLQFCQASAFNRLLQSCQSLTEKSVLSRPVPCHTFPNFYMKRVWGFCSCSLNTHQKLLNKTNQQPNVQDRLRSPKVYPNKPQYPTKRFIPSKKSVQARFGIALLCFTGIPLLFLPVKSQIWGFISPAGWVASQTVVKKQCLFGKDTNPGWLTSLLVTCIYL